MKKIGFVDYYIDEWHANNYPKWFKDICEKQSKEFEVAYAWAEVDKYNDKGLSTAEWCEKYGVTKCDTIEELCEKSDYIIVLSPSDPDKHLGYAKKVLPYKKRTYIDKTFAPDYKTAKEIFDIAKQYDTPFFSSSALRYATEIDGKKCQSIMTTGGGRLLDEYIIHQVEMVVKTMGFGAKCLKIDEYADQKYIHVKFEDNRCATMVFAEGLSFSVYLNKEDNGREFLPVYSDFFKILLADILNFFETGNVSFDVKETLEVMAIRETAIKAQGQIGQWITIQRN